MMRLLAHRKNPRNPIRKNMLTGMWQEPDAGATPHLPAGILSPEKRGEESSFTVVVNSPTLTSPSPRLRRKGKGEGQLQAL
jgi:hypothetical protein